MSRQGAEMRGRHGARGRCGARAHAAEGRGCGVGVKRTLKIMLVLYRTIMYNRCQKLQKCNIRFALNNRAGRIYTMETKPTLRIDYSLFDKVSTKHIEALIMLASGMTSIETSKMITAQYGEADGMSDGAVRNCKKRHEEEYKLIEKHYREQFLVQKMSGIEQGLLQRISASLSHIPIETASDLRNITSAYQSISSARHTIETGNPIDTGTKGTLKCVESTLKKLSGKR